MIRETVKRSVVGAALALVLAMMVVSGRASSASASSKVRSAGDDMLAGQSDASGLAAAFGWQPSLSSEMQGGQGDKPAEQAYKNIQVLKGLPSSQVLPVMNLIRI